jgi:COMPASS component SWD3
MKAEAVVPPTDQQNAIPDSQKTSPGAPSIKPEYQLLYTLHGHTKSISSVKFSPDGQYLATACN